MSGERFANLGFARLRILLEQMSGGIQKTGSAVPALRGAEVQERALNRMQRTGARKALDRLDGAVDRIGCKRQARKDGSSIDDDGAGAALAEFATMFGTGQA